MGGAFFSGVIMDKEKLISLILGQGGATVLACVALWYISQLYVEQIQTMMEKCDGDRIMYQMNIEKLSAKLDDISTDVRVIKDAQTKNH
tara:strand:- start:3133 stop:3399 length:267 start_codon:yes stop_codon:yes gene_type:complete